jgi:hypothetical protein
VRKKEITKEISSANTNPAPGGGIRSKNFNPLHEIIDKSNIGFVGKRKTPKRKPKGRRLRLDGSLVKKERRELPAVTVVVEGTAFIRAHEEGKGRSQEAILRHGENLANMVAEVQRVTREAIRDGKFLPQEEALGFANRKSPVWQIYQLCTEQGAMDASQFTTTKGIQMKENTAFRMVVFQFFRDVDFAGKVVGQASRDYARSHPRD